MLVFLFVKCVCFLFVCFLQRERELVGEGEVRKEWKEENRRI